MPVIITAAFFHREHLPDFHKDLDRQALPFLFLLMRKLKRVNDLPKVTQTKGQRNGKQIKVILTSTPVPIP